MNNEFGLLERDMKYMIGVFIQYGEIEKAVIFGSRAIGNFKQGSDIDIALCGKQLNSSLITRISSCLNQEVAIPYFIDLINYYQIKKIELRKHIDSRGKTIYQKK